ncbi:HEPN family nuclease [Nitrospira sp. Ecomares 2.1]
MGEAEEILDTTTIGRNDAIRFASLTLANLEFLEQAWRADHSRSDGSGIHLVTQTVNSLLGLVVFTCEKKYVRCTLSERLVDLAEKGWPSWTFTLGGAPNHTLGELIYHLRNGAAHARLAFSSDSSLPADVRITVEDALSKTSPVYWRASITAADLLKFCHLYGKHVDEVIG